MGLTEIPAELPCTSLPQRWSVPRGTKIDPEPVPHMTFVNPKPVRKKRPIRNTLTDNRFVTSNILTLKAPITSAADNKFCDIFLNFQKNKV